MITYALIFFILLCLALSWLSWFALKRVEEEQSAADKAKEDAKQARLEADDRERIKEEMKVEVQSLREKNKKFRGEVLTLKREINRALDAWEKNQPDAMLRILRKNVKRRKKKGNRKETA